MGDALTHSRLESEYAHQRGSDQMEAVKRTSPVFVVFIRVDDRDAEQQQDLHGHLKATRASRTNLPRHLRYLGSYTPSVL